MWIWLIKGLTKRAQLMRQARPDFGAFCVDQNPVASLETGISRAPQGYHFWSRVQNRCGVIHVQEIARPIKCCQPETKTNHLYHPLKSATV